MSKFTGLVIMFGSSLIVGLLFYIWSGMGWIGAMMGLVAHVYWWVDWPFRPYPWEGERGN